MNGRRKNSEAPVLYSKSIARRWQSVAANAKSNFVLLSPYLTSSTAETVLNAGTGCTVYTLFELDQFASGASSLRTVKKLKAAGHDIYHLPGLHAKVALVRGVFASVGSQNLTVAGTKRKELTVAFNDSRTTEAIANAIQPWLKDRIQVTDEMIADVEELLLPVKELFDSARKRAAEAQDVLDARRQERLLAEQRRQQEERERLARILAMQKALAAKPKSLQTAFCRVAISDNNNSYTYVHTLLAEDGRHLTEWTIEGQHKRLEAFNRYLCVNESTGHLGWARVVRTRITYINHALISSGAPLYIGGRFYRLRMECERAADPPYGRNLRIDVVRHGSGNLICRLSAWFFPGTLEILHTELIHGGIDSAESGEVAGWIRENSVSFSTIAMNELTKPFRYQSNKAGMQANTFFGSVGTRYRLRLIEEQKNPILVATAR